MSVGVRPGLWWRRFGPVPQLAAKSCSLQAPLPTARWFPRAAVPRSARNFSSPFSHPLKPGPRTWHPGPPPSRPSPPAEAFGIYLAEQGLASSAALELQRGARGWPYQAVKFHWNQGDFFCWVESMQKGCQDLGLTCYTWVEEGKWKSFQWACLLCNIKPYNESTFTSL